MEGLQTKIKFCGLMRECDILAANEIRPDYIGFVFAKKSRDISFPAKAFQAAYPCIRRIGDHAIGRAMHRSNLRL